MGEMGRNWSKGKHFSCIDWTGSGDLRHSIVTTVENIVQYIERLQGDGAHPHQWQPSEITDMLISSAVAIISQSMQLSKHHIPHDKIYHLAHLLFPNKAGELKSIWWISWFLYWAKQLVFTPAVHYSCLRNSTEKKKKNWFLTHPKRSWSEMRVPCERL